MELLIVTVLLTIGVLAYARTMLQAERAEQTSREALKATQDARGVLEGMACVEFSELYARYNATTADDPASGSSPGATFTVDGLAGGPGAVTAEILFPEVGGAHRLREDADLPELGLPRDLNGDGAIDSSDHSSDYVLLPVLVRVEWTGQSRSRVELKTLFSAR